MKRLVPVVFVIFTLCGFAQEKESSFKRTFYTGWKQELYQVRGYGNIHTNIIKQFHFVEIGAGISFFSTKNTAWHFEGTFVNVNNGDGYIFLPKIGAILFIGEKYSNNVKIYLNFLTGFALGYAMNEIIDGANFNSRLGVLFFSNSYISLDFFAGHNLLTLNNAVWPYNINNRFKNYIQLGCRVFFF